MAKILELTADSKEQLCKVGNALSSPVRIEILKLLYYNSYNVGEIADKLQIPASSAALHIRTLEDADLIQTKTQPGTRGSMKLCSRKNDFINIRLSGIDPNVNQVLSISMPIGAFTDCEITPTCGIASEHAPIGYEDRPSDFFLPERIHAQILWTSSGFVEYKFPFPINEVNIPKSLMLSFETCSEAPNYKENWKSDITIWVNGVDCGTWQSPGDFGSRRGRLNPSWWDSGVTQHGMLITLEVNEAGSYINSAISSTVNIQELDLSGSNSITIRIGNKPDAQYIGGFNLFGEKFGDFAQNILLSFVY
ncbi:MAG: ArsR family transcriptional regulator [Anaerolineaceae bacterium]|nr:MAG: ArsR family transcriptional regulator [Anaerolineaceae bacterium]